jgi:sialic acid synthase SpsE/quercetin dioxygenase-like cupin family protein
MRLSSEQKFDFNNLFVFEMANNHQGSVEHGIRIINAMADLAEKHGVRGSVKLQFRDLDTFIHPDHKESKEIKHIPRFLSTRLTEEQFGELVEATKRRGLISMCTPFDEVSVDGIEKLGIEIIKIGSCSAHDWPLLERVAQTGKPVICSTGGLTIKDIDRIVSFFQHRGVDFALMHCVAIYPSPNEKLHLNQLETMRNRYPGVTIGFSTHEDPGNTTAVMLAYAKGARMFEKHVGVATDKITLNAYSANPDQVDAWISAYKEAVAACGGEGEREISEKEKADLDSLKRGVYAKVAVKKGEALNREDVFFAMPYVDGQLVSGEWKDGLKADKDYGPNEAIGDVVRPKARRKKDVIYPALHAIKGMINMAKIPVSHDVHLELSHHHGLENFDKVGCTLIEFFNREYAKKLIIQLPGQLNPVHYHKKKDETFHVISGTLEVEIDGKNKVLEPGDTLWVPRGVWHGFGTKTGAIFEEISTTSHSDDSFYVDKEIAKLPRETRKTKLHNWGRHQFDHEDMHHVLGEDE